VVSRHIANVWPTATETTISDIKYGHVAGKDFISLKAYCLGDQNGSYRHKVSNALSIRMPLVDKGSTLVGVIALSFLQCFDTVGWEEHLTCKTTCATSRGRN